MISTWDQQQLFEDLMSRVSYRPGYEIQVAPFDASARDYHMGTTLRFSKVDDDPRHWGSAETGQPQIRFGFQRVVPRHVEHPEDALRFLRSVLREFEDYIADQWLRVDGVLLKAPE